MNTCFNPITIAPYHEPFTYPYQFKEEEQDFTSFNEQDLLLTTGFYPTFSTNTMTEAYTLSYPMSDSSSSSSSSPDIMTCQYNYFPSPSPTYSPIEPNFDFFPFIQQDIQLTSPIITTTNATEHEPYQNNITASPQQKRNTNTSMEGRPYPCHLCKRAFARKHDLQRHIRVHTGDKPYVCPCCKKAFARTDALKRHLRMEEQCRSSQEVQAMKSLGRKKYKNL